MADKKVVLELKEKSYELRKKLLLLAAAFGQPVHMGGDLSVVEILTVLYHYGMNIDPKNIRMPTRDRFILSKGHAAVGMYITMAIRGFFDYDEIVRTYGKLDTAFGMHPCKVQLPGVEISSGSLGQGLAISCGLALAGRARKEAHRVFCLMGDGETCEGEVWESAMTAASYNLGNLIGIVDRNRQFMTSFSEKAVKLEPYAAKWKAFGWRVVEIDGHDMATIVNAIDNLPAATDDTPTVIIGNTVKGHGVSFMENNVAWHAGMVSEDDWNKAKDELNAAYKKKGGAV